MKLGAHKSAAGGIYNVISRAAEDCCESVQLFVKSPNRWLSPSLNQEEIELFLKQAADFGVSNIAAHSAYLINLASPKDDVREKSVSLLKDEVKICGILGVPFYVMHPGSPLDSGFEAGITRIVQGIDSVFSDVNASVMLLLETTAGMGTSIGGRFEHLQMICDRVKDGARVGVCLDTCHVHAAGYDISNGYDQVIDDFFYRFGAKLKVVHLNDSKNPLGARKDRHDFIGKGTIGLETFGRIVNDSRFQDVLGVLETPAEDGIYKAELELLKSLRR